jgi:hypothetical protein
MTCTQFPVLNRLRPALKSRRGELLLLPVDAVKTAYVKNSGETAIG